MKDVTQILLSGLVPALGTATGKTVYTRIPKAKNATYPYVYVYDIYLDEEGDKTHYRYKLDVLIQVVYMDADSLVGLFTDRDNILNLVKNGVAPFAIASPYTIVECGLNSASSTEIQTETGTQNIAIIRLLFTIE